MLENQLYKYKAIVTKVYDGDTCTLNIDLGLHIWIYGENVRLARINAKEVRGEERPDGLLARDFLSTLILNKEIYIETIKDTTEKYGRYLVEIILIKEDGTELNVNDYLVENNYAEYKAY